MAKENTFNRLSIIFLALFSMFLGVLASCRERTDKDAILDFVDAIGSEVESRDSEALLARLTDDYRDFEGRDRSRTGDLLSEYFGRPRGVVMNILGTRFDTLDASRASIRTEVSFSSGAARVLRKLLRISTESYRFRLTLIKKAEGWKIQHAAWEEINPDELSPESQRLFQKLFPDF
jgi:hypothetical protein